MYIQDIIGELLYIGIVAEKGRCYGMRWKFGYKRILKRHIIALSQLQKCLKISDKELSCSIINDFFVICEKNSEIAKFYNFSVKKIDELMLGKSYEKINQFMNELFCDLLKEINKPNINKRKVYDLLCALHNLPRVYLGSEKETLCNLKQQAISEEDAIKYTFDNLDTSLRNKYKSYNKSCI